MTSFPHRLRELREAAGLSQKQLADKSGASQKAVSSWEQGVRVPSWDNVLALAAALGVTCEAFNKPAKDAEPRTPGRPAKAAEQPTEPPTKAKASKPRKQK